VSAGLDPAIRAWIEAEVGSFDEPSAIGSGASRQIWRIDAAAGPLVARVDTGTGPVAGTALDLAREAVVYGALRDRGLPVPHLRAVEPLGRALLMDLAEGDDALAAVADPDDRAAIAGDYLRWLGRLHLLDPATLDLPGWTHPVDAADHARLDLGLWSAIAAERATGWMAPATPFALGWLDANAPSGPTRTSLCHGDAGPGNFLFRGRSVTALLDWEFAHVGDPLDDLAWVAVRNHLLRARFDLPSAFAVWRETTGSELDPARLEYYRALVLTRMLVSCDATVRWSDGAETDESRTQMLLRPLLAQCIGQALRRAGCTDPDLAAVERDAAPAWAASPLVPVFGETPTLEDFGALR
jgi:aminoglycoside phosphotransferase (APT) family kinase protein